MTNELRVASHQSMQPIPMQRFESIFLFSVFLNVRKVNYLPIIVTFFVVAVVVVLSSFIIIGRRLTKYVFAIVKLGQSHKLQCSYFVGQQVSVPTQC